MRAWASDTAPPAVRYVVPFGAAKPYPTGLRERSPDYGSYRAGLARKTAGSTEALARDGMKAARFDARYGIPVEELRRGAPRASASEEEVMVERWGRRNPRAKAPPLDSGVTPCALGRFKPLPPA